MTIRVLQVLRGLTVTTLCVAALAGTSAYAQGTIAGRIDLDPLPPVERRPAVTALGMAPPQGQPDRRRSVVYLEAAPRAAFEQRPPRRATMDQRNEMFVPRVLAIMVGDAVEFPNSDPTYHNVFSFSRARTFDLGRYPAGRSRSVRFDRPGIVRVFCDIHSHMSAFILVFAHPYFAVTDAEGRYRIENVPAGSYTLAVWNEALPAATRDVVVTSDGTVEADFLLASR